jgi:YhcH/YjgK/YiaL family protein
VVFDHLAHSHLYEAVTARMHHAFKFLRREDLAMLPVGKYPIDGDDVYALVQEYQTKPADKAKWEGHRQYLDVQYVASGVERMGYGYSAGFEVTKEYDAAGDYLLFSGIGNELVMTPGMFAIFSPHDVHRPTVAVDQPMPVRKIVVKVRVD